jgi:ATP-dependent DNA helicase UvrD/PcrA
VSTPDISRPSQRGSSCKSIFLGALAGRNSSEVVRKQVEAKQAQGVLDYDDLLLYWAQMMSDPGLAAHIGERFDHVLVDEHQDTNRLQSSILLALKPGGRV